MAIINEIALIIFISCIVLYSLLLIYGSKHEVLSKRNVLKIIYKDWTDVRLEKDNDNATAQALRNFIMGNSFLHT